LFTILQFCLFIITKKKPVMTVNALLPPTLNQQDDEVFKMMDVGEFGEFSELNDFLGDIDLHPVDISPISSHEYSLSMMTGAAVSAPAPEVPHHQFNTMMAPVSPDIVAQTTTNSNNNAVLPVAPVLSSSSRISPAPSVSSGGESSGDESSVNNHHNQQQQQQNRKVPSTVVTTTSKSIQETHLRNMKAATKAAASSSSPPQENVQLKKDRRRYV
jgi:hypothetical protein